jgi:hypothetical protein
MPLVRLQGLEDDGLEKPNDPHAGCHCFVFHSSPKCPQTGSEEMLDFPLRCSYQDLAMRRPRRAGGARCNFWQAPNLTVTLILSRIPRPSLPLLLDYCAPAKVDAIHAPSRH